MEPNIGGVIALFGHPVSTRFHTMESNTGDVVIIIGHSVSNGLHTIDQTMVYVHHQSF